jgi:hypothetical protein
MRQVFASIWPIDVFESVSWPTDTAATTPRRSTTRKSCITATTRNSTTAAPANSHSTLRSRGERPASSSSSTVCDAVSRCAVTSMRKSQERGAASEPRPGDLHVGHQPPRFRAAPRRRACARQRLFRALRRERRRRDCHAAQQCVGNSARKGVADAKTARRTADGPFLQDADTKRL